MQLVRSDFIHKTNETITSAARNTSCSHGWLRLVVQCIFFAITVTSFILILILTLSTYWRNNSARCQIQSCRVVCYDAPFNGLYENEIIFAVAEAETRCEWVLLTLNRPVFTHSTLPPRWLSRMRTNIHELAIIGGNLRNISPLAFMTQFTGNVRCLIFEKITLESWKPHTFVGLSNLEELIIKDVYINALESSALEAVDDTLQTLRVTASGRWNPKYITGTTNFDHLVTVDFSSNLFERVIDRESFTNLKDCEVLFLNSCGIKAIGEGAFDNLAKLEILHLNNNLLVTVPDGLFKTISLNNMLRVHLHDNTWFCDCTTDDIRLLSDSEMIVVDPICYFPEQIRGKSLKEFYDHCPNETDNYNEENYRGIEYIRVNGSCNTVDYNKSNLKIISPIDKFSCPLTKFRGIDLNILKYFMERAENLTFFDFLRPTFSVKFDKFSMFEISSSKFNRGFGVLWYQSKCPNAIYCLNALPRFLRIYDFDDTSSYTFCLLQLSSGVIHDDKCILYNAQQQENKYVPWTVFYVFTAILSLTMGAMCVYVIIRKYPSLLKGNKRIVFVKHKNLTALVLPPTVPLRINEKDRDIPEDKNTHENNYYLASPFKRTKSMISTMSNAPSYISAVQPTEDQLAEWRLQNHFLNNGIPSISSYVTNDNSMYIGNLSHEEYNNKGYDCDVH